MSNSPALDAPAGAELIQRAAVSTSGLNQSALLERAFAFLFRGLVYPQIWEDPVADMAGLRIQPGENVVTIASGGCNALSYLTADPSRVTAIDLNRAHVALGRLKLAAALHLPDYAHFRAFFVDADRSGNVDAYYAHISPHLDASSRAYWETRDFTGRKRIAGFSRGFYRYGLLGSFIGAAHWVARLHGIDPREVLNARGMEEQRRHFEKHFVPLFEKPLIRWMTNQPASLFGLGIPPAQYDKLAGTRRMVDVLRERLERLTCDFDFRDNYFAWQAFARSYDPAPEASLPPYLQEANYQLLRERAGKAEIRQDNMTDYLARQEAQSIDCYLLLDAQDWMTDQQLGALWSQICRTGRPGARVLFRTADEPTLLPGRLANDLLEMWHYREEQSRELTAQDRSSIYGGTHLYVRSN